MKPAALGVVAFVLAMALVVAFAPREDAAGASDAARLGASSFGAPDERPAWVVGDAWRVQFDDGEPVCWAVVTAADDAGYRQGLWCPTDEAGRIAAQIAIFRPPYVGNYTPELAARGLEEDVDLFRWPLQDGATWQTQWYGEIATVTARFEPDHAGPQGREPAYVMTVEIDGETRATYDYVPSLGWFSTFEYASGYTFRVHERVAGWDMGASTGNAGVTYRITSPVQAQLQAMTAFDVSPETEYVGFELSAGGMLLDRLVVYDPDGGEAWAPGLSMTTGVLGSVYNWQIVDAVPGEWTMSHTGASSGGISFVAWEVDVVPFGA